MRRARHDIDAAVAMLNRKNMAKELVLRRALRVVLAAESPKYSIVTLRVGSRVWIDGSAPLPGFVEVVCAKVRYYAREEALRAHSTAFEA